ncbi:MAG: acyl-CoA thioesterase [Desulfurivibrio sp.]|nr:acyl-CoA thioesterase [Desulfurivibrio sp.]MBU4119765.1 acyl-CoA thioesterase [Pseudomonadota bacterium]
MTDETMNMCTSLHHHRFRVIYGDTDSGGVVYYANYLRYFEAARTEFMRDRALSYKEIEAQGFILPVVECHVRYKASARYDDLLLVETSLVEVKSRTCRFDYRVIREIDGKMLAQGFTTHAIVDIKGRLTKFPDMLLGALRKYSADVT